MARPQQDLQARGVQVLWTAHTEAGRTGHAVSRTRQRVPEMKMGANGRIDSFG